jgi:hypothetical protein
MKQKEKQKKWFISGIKDRIPRWLDKGFLGNWGKDDQWTCSSMKE